MAITINGSSAAGNIDLGTNGTITDLAVGGLPDGTVDADTLASGAGGAALTGSTDNTICTVTGANAIQGESNLTFDGTKLGIGTSTHWLDKVTIKNDVAAGTHNWMLHLLNGTHASDSRAGIAFQGNNATAANTWDGAGIYASNNGVNGACNLHFGSVEDGSFTERLRLMYTGQQILYTGDTVWQADIGGAVRMQLAHTGGGDVTWSNPSSGSATYSTSSDYRLKQDAVALPNAWSTVKALKPYEYKWKHNTSKTSQGFFAHEVIETVPNSQAGQGVKDAMRAETYYTKDDTLPSGKKIGDVKTYSSTVIEPQQIDYSKLVPLLTKALQEAITEIETLKTKVAALEAG